MRRLTTEEFIRRAKVVHGNKYDYSKINYINNRTKICVICHEKDEYGNEHGEFWIEPSHHINGVGCRECWKKSKRLTTEEFIEKARKIHGDKYDYSKTDLDNRDEKGCVCIICKKCGKEFWQRPSGHLQNKGCLYCGGTKKSTTEEFIEKAKEVHGDKYDYSKVEYVNSYTPVCIICPEHGEFFINANNFIRGNGCVDCSNKKRTKKLDEFINESRKIHGDKYDYSKVIYKNNYTKVCIVCKKCNYEFYQTPHSHLRGNGCPSCNESKLENEINIFLKENNLKFIQQCNCNTFKWLGKQSLDFYLPDYKAAIECQGEEHFRPVEFFGGEEAFKEQRNRDKIKKKICNENNINIFYFTNIKNIKFFDKVYYNKDKLIKSICLK